MEKIVFMINGGCGKCIAATAVCKAIKKQKPDCKLIVISGYPDVFINNPNVDKALLFGNFAYFFEDNVEGCEEDVTAFMHDPYVDAKFHVQDKHLIETWCKMFDVPYDNEMPEIFLTPREIELYQKDIRSDKPIMLLHTNGGGDLQLKYGWARDIPTTTVVALIDHFKEKYNIVHVKREDQIGYQNTQPISGGIRPLMALALRTDKRILIDSQMQHACAALGLPSVVCWIANKPEVFGYEMHTNVLANPFTHKPDLRKSFLTKLNFQGDAEEFAYNFESEIFDVQKIIDAVEAMDKDKDESLPIQPKSDVPPSRDDIAPVIPIDQTTSEKPRAAVGEDVIEEKTGTEGVTEIVNIPEPVAPPVEEITENVVAPEADKAAE